MHIATYDRGADVQLTPHFHLREVECRCGACPRTLVDLDHLRCLEALRRRLGDPSIRITSGYRCRAHNAAVGGHPTSEHMEGIATDVVVDGVAPSVVAAVADDMVPGFGGLGRYDDFTHLDSRVRLSRWDRRSALA